MSEADQWQADVVAHGVKLKRDVNRDDYSVPSLVFTIRGPVDGPATVRVRDPIPEDVGAGDVGFHPKEGGEFWTYEGDHVTFTRTFAPGEAFRTVYGIVGADPESEDWPSADPTVEVLDGAAAEDASTASGPASADEGPPVDDGGLLPRLARELDEGAYAAEDRERIREALLGSDVADLREEVDELAATVASLPSTADGAPADDVGSLEAELASLRGRVDALAEEADDPGDLSTELASINDRLDAVEAAVPEGLAGELSAIRDRVEAVEADGAGPAPRELAEAVETLDERVESLAAEVESVREERASTTEAVESLVERIDDVHESWDDLSEDVEAATEGVRRNARDIDDIGAEVTELATTVDSIPVEQIPGADGVDALEAEVEGMRDDLEAVVSFQERLSRTLLALDEE